MEAEDQTLRIKMERALEKLRLMETLMETKDNEIQLLKNKVNQIRADKDVVSMLLSTLLSEIDGESGVWFGEESNMNKVNRLQSFISTLKSKKKQAESVAEMKSSFLANMSHEIRTPMNGIMGLTKLLLNTETSEKQNEYLRSIESSSDTLLVIINDILDISKIEAGKLTIESNDFLLLNLLNSVVAVFEGRAADKGIHIVSKYDEGELPEVLVGDSVRLNQILYNLISNAIKFTAKGSVSLTVETLKKTEKDVTLNFIVSDTGIGMSSEQVYKAFDAFSQANSSTTRQFGGTGLGLSIVKNLVELQGGNIVLNSEEGKGSSFLFELTFKYKNYSELNISKKENDLLRDLAGVNILLVEDNPVNQLVAIDLLTEVNANVEVANNGAEGVELFNSKKHDIILMDMQMPVMDGYETISKLRALGFKVPIIALTAHIAESEIDKCMACGANEYLSKPYKPSDLFKRISKLIGSESSTNSYLEEPLAENRYKVKLWDKSYLLDYVGGSEKVMSMFLEKIVSEIPSDIQTLINTQTTKDLKNLALVCHKMKPNIKMLGNLKLYDDIVELEFANKTALNQIDIQEKTSALVVNLRELLAQLI